jgi:hypothetical protein
MSFASFQRRVNRHPAQGGGLRRHLKPCWRYNLAQNTKRVRPFPIGDKNPQIKLMDLREAPQAAQPIQRWPISARDLQPRIGRNTAQGKSEPIANLNPLATLNNCRKHGLGVC